MDPLAEKYLPLSPFNYCINNPVKFVDSDGRVVAIPDQASQASLVADINIIADSVRR